MQKNIAPDIAIWALQLIVYNYFGINGTRNLLTIDRRYETENSYEAFCYINGMLTPEGNVYTNGITASTGKLRLKRTGTVATFYYHNGLSWVQTLQIPNFVTSHVTIQIRGVTTSEMSIDCFFDNFIINSGTITWESD